MAKMPSDIFKKTKAPAKKDADDKGKAMNRRNALTDFIAKHKKGM